MILLFYFFFFNWIIINIAKKNNNFLANSSVGFFSYINIETVNEYFIRSFQFKIKLTLYALALNRNFTKLLFSDVLILSHY